MTRDLRDHVPLVRLRFADDATSAHELIGDWSREGKGNVRTRRAVGAREISQRPSPSPGARSSLTRPGAITAPLDVTRQIEVERTASRERGQRQFETISNQIYRCAAQGEANRETGRRGERARRSRSGRRENRAQSPDVEARTRDAQWSDGPGHPVPRPESTSWKIFFDYYTDDKAKEKVKMSSFPVNP